MNKKIVVLAIISIILGLAAPAIAQTSAFTTTTIYYNVAALNEVKVTLLGSGTWTTATGSGAATPSNIEFNSSTPNNAWLEAKVTGGGSQQSTGNPIVKIDNTGSTTVIHINISTLAAPPSCNDLHFRNDTWTATPADEAQLNTTNVTLVTNWPYDGAQLSVYLWGNFSGCGMGTQSGTFRVFADWA